MSVAEPTRTSVTPTLYAVALVRGFVTDDYGLAVGLGLPDVVGLGVGVGVGVGVGLGVADAEGVGVAVRDAVGVGVGLGLVELAVGLGAGGLAPGLILAADGKGTISVPSRATFM